MNTRKSSLIFYLASAILCFAFTACSDDDDDDGRDHAFSARKEIWGDIMRGDDHSLAAFPDTYAYYWEYTFDVQKNPNIGLRIEGCYPKARFFNFNCYDEELQYSECEHYSIMDVDIKPDAGFVNPFVTETDLTHQEYTVYVLPEGKSVPEAKNVINFKPNSAKAGIFLRYYIPQGEPFPFAGQALPNIVAFDLTTGDEVKLPAREYSAIRGEMTIPGGAFPDAPNMVFMRAPFSMFYPNGPAEYLFNRNRLKADEIMYFNFKTVSYPQNVGEYRTSDVRYWSIGVGNEDTYTYASICDCDTKIDADGFAHYVIADANSPKIAEIRTACTQREYNLIEWNRAEWKEGVMILYRHMVFDEDAPFSMRKLKAFDPANPTGMPELAHTVLGAYGPFGKKLSETAFLTNGAPVIRQ